MRAGRGSGVVMVVMVVMMMMTMASALTLFLTTFQQPAQEKGSMLLCSAAETEAARGKKWERWAFSVAFRRRQLL